MVSRWAGLLCLLLSRGWSEETVHQCGKEDLVWHDWWNPLAETSVHIPPVCTELFLQEVFLGCRGARALAVALQSHRKLRVLDLHENNIGHSGGKALGEALISHPSLWALFLHHNAIGPPGAAALASALASPDCHLKALHLNINYLGDDGVVALSRGLAAATSLELLDLSYNSFGPRGAEALGEALQSNSGLKALHLYGDQMSDTGASALAKALTVHSHLLELYINDDTITATGAAALGASLGGSGSQLRHFRLKRSSGCDAFAAALAPALKRNGNYHLSELGLSNCGLTDEGAKHLASEENQALTVDSSPLPSCNRTYQRPVIWVPACLRLVLAIATLATGQQNHRRGGKCTAPEYSEARSGFRAPRPSGQSRY